MMIRPSNNATGKSSRIDTYPSKGDKPDLELVKTISSSDDEDDQEEERLHEGANVDAEAFLDSYEEMLRYQKDEMEVTLYHLQPLLELLQSQQHSSGKSSRTTSTTTPFTREFTYASLKQALDQMKEDDSLRIASHDRQWKFVLQLLTENDHKGTAVHPCNECISWAEIVMCYRMCVLAMQTLSQTSEPNALRARVRQRSLQMLASFRPKPIETTKPAASTPRNGKRYTLEWVESIFIAGSMILFAIFMFGFLPRNNAIHSVYDSNPNARFYETPLIPGPHVQPFAVGNLKSPKQTTFLGATDELLIPGPTVTPVYSKEQSVDGGLRLSEQYVSSSPSSVMPAKELPIAPKDSTTKAVKMLVKGPLDSWSATSQDDIPDKPVNSVQHINDKNEGALVTAVGVVTVAGGIAATSILAPMTTSLLGALGSTLPGLFSIGATVLVSTLLAHGIRDVWDSIRGKVRQALRR